MGSSFVLPCDVDVKLHGYLAAFGPRITVRGGTLRHILEAAQRVCTRLQSNGPLGRHRVTIPGVDCEADLDKPHDGSTVHIFPQLSGGKTAGLAQILVGGLLVGASFLIPGSGFLASSLFAFGAAFVVGGVVAMLSPKPDDNLTSKSKYLGAPKNTVAVGTRIPIPYGKNRLYGHYLSFNVWARLVPPS
jgi:predicted phage tail protein